MIVLLLAAQALATEFVLLPEGSTWSFLDTGVDPGPDWIEPDFDDTTWLSGAAPLGYGAVVATVVDYGPDPLDKHVTTWFRADFSAVGTATMTALALSLRADDGAIVYLNGVEVHRRNLPDGPIAADTLATTPTNGVASFEPVRVPLDTAQLVEGDNVLAVEVHQHMPGSPDLVLEAALHGYDGATAVVRGPYLQQTSDDGTVIRWRTLGPSESTVWYGSAPGQLTQQVDVPGLALDHEVRLDGLGPSTTWTYAVGSVPDGMLVGDDALHTFRTHPLPGTRDPLRIWVLGDSGTADASAMAVRDAYATYSGGLPPDVLLMLGDNAYGSGTDEEYQEAMFDIYPSTLRQVAAWSTIGNHDGYSASSLLQTGPYFDIFTLPTGGEVGGEPSGTEAYYSFDVANIHFVCLDSNGSDRGVGGAMLAWLEADLAATTADWVIAFWHHPPYTKGSHDSDYELALIEMRANALPILEDYGVDLVLTGHSHSYERSFLVDGHYGTSETLEQYMLLDDSDGSRDDGFAYRKPTVGPGSHEGAVHVVAGSSGKKSGGKLDHPVMQVSLNELGSLVIDVHGDELDAVFLQDDGSEGDRFAIDKGVTSIVALDGPRAGEKDQLLSWAALALHPDGSEVGSYSWTFGDGAVGSGAAVSHTYTAEGTFPVALTVLDQAGQPVVRTFDVEVDDGAPDIDPIVAPSPVEGEEVTLVASAVDQGGTEVAFSWDLGDGTVVDGDSVTHAWVDDGTYDVVLTATDEDGESAVSVVQVTVANGDPVLDELIVPAPAEGAVASLVAAAIDPGLDDVLTYTWDLNDGSAPIVGASVEVVFADDGPHTVTLEVSDGDGGLYAEDVVVTVENVAPTIEAVEAAGAVDEGTAVRFVAAATDPGDDDLVLTWQFDDGEEAVGASVDHAWGDDGVYTVVLTVNDGDGGFATERFEVTVANVRPAIVDVQVPPTAHVGAEVVLAARATDPGHDDLVTLIWDVGDGAVRTGEEVRHAWDTAGRHVVTITAMDDEGASATVEVPVEVAHRPVSQVEPVEGAERGCACATASWGVSPWLLVLLALVGRRR